MDKKEKEKAIEAQYQIELGGGTLVDHYLVLDTAGLLLRLTYEYSLDDKGDRYTKMLSRFDVNSGGDITIVPAPMHMRGTYMFMGHSTARSNGLSHDGGNKFWVMLRGYNKLRFNSKFMPYGSGQFRPACFDGNRNNAEAVVVPDARLTAPEGYRYVVVMTPAPGMFLFGVRDSDHAVFRVPLPNMTFSSGALCEGVSLHSEVLKTVRSNCNDVSVFSDLLNAWETAQWNSDLTNTLPQDDAKKFLTWDIYGKHLADSKLWDKMAEDWPLDTGYEALNGINAAIKSYMKETDHALYVHS